MNILQLNNRLPYNPKFKQRTRDLRKNMTQPEKKLWFWYLKEFSNTKFRVYRQRPIDNFIVDFYIPKLKLIIEIDWESHFIENWIEYDKERTDVLNWLWLKVIRYTNDEIMKNMKWVLEDLKNKIC